MQRMLESQDTTWNWGDNPSETFSRAGTDEVENWPMPREVFFEAGIVLGAALGTCAAVDLLLTILGVPQIYYSTVRVSGSE